MCVLLFGGQIGTEISDWVAAFWGLEPHHPITSMLAGHGSWVKRKKERIGVFRSEFYFSVGR